MTVIEEIMKSHQEIWEAKLLGLMRLGLYLDDDDYKKLKDIRTELHDLLIKAVENIKKQWIEENEEKKRASENE